MLEPVVAVEHIRRMRGGSQPHLMRCSDDNYYVVKFQNNPQGTRILVNDFLGTSLAEYLGLPVPRIAIVEVDQSLIENTDELVVQLRNRNHPCQHGSCFGSRHLLSGPESDMRRVYDIFPDEQLRKVENLASFAGMLVFDKWVCNTDWRQTVFARKSDEAPYTVSMIDQGSCFNGEHWNFPDAPLCGIYRHQIVYEGIQGIEAFSEWMNRLQRITLSAMFSVVETVPPDWYGADLKSLYRLLERLDRRRHDVSRLIMSAWETSPRAFSNWRQPRSVRVA